jgi:hypothetical protein
VIGDIDMHEWVGVVFRHNDRQAVRQHILRVRDYWLAGPASYGFDEPRPGSGLSSYYRFGLRRAGPMAVVTYLCAAGGLLLAKAVRPFSRKARKLAGA